MALQMTTSLPHTHHYTLHTDGACSPNPGPMGIGYTIHAGWEGQGGGGGPVLIAQKPLVRVGAQIGEGTNNEAEYRALIEGLRHALRLGMWNIHVRTDANLMVQQLRGVWKVRDKGLQMLHREAGVLLSLFNNYSITHIFREFNGEADALSHTMTYEEPPLPAPPPNRALLDWQAAAIKHWFRWKTRNTYLLGRIFGITDSQVHQIGAGAAYKHASFDSLPILT